MESEKIMEELIKNILGWDIRAFYFLNKSLMNPVFDVIMPVITNEAIILVPVILVSLYFLIKGSKRTRIAIICMIVAVLLADAVAYRLIKPYFGRLRPCDVLPGVHILAQAGKYSFPSNHAANMMALSVITLFFYRRYGWLIFSIALIVGYSRIYVGVHYPLDVLSGFVLGGVTALLVLLVYNGIELQKSSKKEAPGNESKKQKKKKGAL